MADALFSLMADLSQYSNPMKLLSSFVASLNDLYPRLKISFSPHSKKNNPLLIEIATAENHFGYLQLKTQPSVEENEKIKQAARMVAILLQNIRQKEIIDNKKTEFRETVEQKSRQLKEGEKKYRTVFENTGTATIIIEQDTTISLVNQQFTKLYGAPKDQIENKMSWTEFVHPDDLGQMKTNHYQRRKPHGKAPRNYEFRLIDTSGKQHYISITIDMIPGTKKSVASFLDITKRKKAEERLREREEHFKALFYQNSSVLMLVDPESGKIHDVNNKAAEFYGYSRKQLKSMKVQNINTLSDKEIKAEMSQAARQKRNYFIFSHQLANGEIRDVEIYTGPITIQGKPLLYSTIHDITRETQNRTRLQKGEQIARIGHWEFDLNNGRVYSSKGARNIYGIEKENLDMEEVQRVPLKNYRRKMDQALNDLVQKGKTYDQEFKIKRPSDNQVRDIHSIAEYNPRRNIVFGIIQDITERKETEKELKQKNEELQAAEEELRASNEELRYINDRLEKQKHELKKAKEKAEESDQLKSAFLANMSHEIRTPMNGIMGFAQLLNQKELNAQKRKEFLSIIHGRTKHLLQIINDIVDISKIEANQLDIYPEDFDLNELMNRLYKEQIKELKDLRKSHIKLYLSKDIKKSNFRIKADSNRLRQVLDNLLSNAVKFTEKGSIEFGYRLEHQNGIDFFVRDTGIGIPQEKQQEIFERFRQADESSSRRYEGTGLGLTISKNLVEMMGGEIWMKPREKKGSCFCFFLPCEKSQKEDNYPPQADLEKYYDWKDKTILLVEDDTASQEYLKEGLEPTGVKIFAYETAEKALESIQQEDGVHLVLMDIRLPGMNGLEATKQLRNITPEIPVIAQTAHAMEEDRKKCIEAGATDYISKPIDMPELLALMNRYI